MLLAQEIVSQPSFFGASGLLTAALVTLVLVVVSAVLYFLGGDTGVGLSLFTIPTAFIFLLLTGAIGADGVRGNTVPRAEIAQVYGIPEADLPETVSAPQSPFTLPDGRVLMRSDQRELSTGSGIVWVVE